MSLASKLLPALAGVAFSAFSLPALADGGGDGACAGLPDFGQLRAQLTAAVAASGNGGLGLNMWGTIVANDGTVCAVAFSGSNYTSQWLGSRVISAQKANTGTDFSLSKGAPPASSPFHVSGLALSTANLYSAVQPGGSLYGLQHSNPVDAEIAYRGDATLYGTPADPLVGRKVGGVNVFGGGLALYAKGGIKVGGVGVSGDTSCTDHFVVWHLRHNLNLDYLSGVGGVSGDPTHPDNIIFDITPTSNGGLLDPNGTLSKSAGGFGHPTCLNTGNPASLPVVR